MFIQVLRGQVSDRDGLRAAVEDWKRDLAPGASGWLGSTGGVTDGGEGVAIVRFESEEDARRNSDRPEQGEWWARASRCFSGEVSFQESADVDVDLHGDPNDAGFVQVMQGRITDPQRARQIMARNPDAWAEARPDVIGSLIAFHEGGEFTMTIYFTSEEAAREGEKKEAPPELKAEMEEMNAMSQGVPEFLDLRHPWLDSPS
jgi:hypothetical protein